MGSPARKSFRDSGRSGEDGGPAGTRRGRMPRCWHWRCWREPADRPQKKGPAIRGGDAGPQMPNAGVAPDRGPAQGGKRGTPASAASGNGIAGLLRSSGRAEHVPALNRAVGRWTTRELDLRLLTTQIQPMYKFQCESEGLAMKSTTSAGSHVHPIEHAMRSFSKADVRAASRTAYANKRRRELERVVEELARRIDQNAGRRKRRLSA